MGRKLVWGLRGLGAIAVIGAAAFFALAPGIVERGQNATLRTDWPVSPQAQALHDRLIIGDWHSDALLWDRDLSRRSDRGHVDLPRLAAGNVALQVLTTVTKSPKGQNYTHNESDAPDNITPLVIAQARPPSTWTSLLARALDQAGRAAALAAAHPDDLRLILTRADLAEHLAERAAGGKRIAAILGAEGAHALSGQSAALDQLYDAGFRLIGLTHFFDNELGGSLHGSGDAGGLTDFGRQIVAQMIDRQMIIDLAHASPAMVRDVLAMPGARPIVSHTGIHSHCPSPRNIPDDLMQAVAAKGGVIGIGYWSEVTCGDTPDAIAAAIAAAITLVGEDHVSLGSDFDGAATTPFDAAGLPALTEALLQRGLSEETIAKVMGGNMMRYLSETLPN